MSEHQEHLTITCDPGPLARLEALKKDSAVPQVVFHRLADGETLKEIAKEWQVPRGAFVLWFTTTHAELYDAALKVRADELAHDALTISDEQNEVVKRDGSTFDPDVSRDKLRVETRLRLAEKFDRARYGSKDSGPAGGGITVVVDRSCGGTVAITAGDTRLQIGAGGVSTERVVSGAEASDVLPAGEL